MKCLSSVKPLLVCATIIFAFVTVVAQDGTWTTKRPMPTPRAHLGVGEVNGILYTVGGYNQALPGISTSVVEAYDPATDT